MKSDMQEFEVSVLSRRMHLLLILSKGLIYGR